MLLIQSLIDANDFYFSYSICVRPEEGYDCVQWQVNDDIVCTRFYGRCHILQNMKRYETTFRFVPTNHVGPQVP